VGGNGRAREGLSNAKIGLIGELKKPVKKNGHGRGTKGSEKEGPGVTGLHGLPLIQRKRESARQRIGEGGGGATSLTPITRRHVAMGL